MQQINSDYDYVIIGGGFYGCCLALFLRSISDRILIVESQGDILTRASRVNQARVHTGFHYPRSVLTAARSASLSDRFAADFPDAIVSNFQMLYAIGKLRSKVPAGRFYKMFTDLRAPIRPANAVQAALFDASMIEAVFECTEKAFNYKVLQRHLRERLQRHGIEFRLGTDVSAIRDQGDHVDVALSDGASVSAAYLFNVTYSNINTILSTAGLPVAQLKHELAELALIKPPPLLAGFGVTVMDGPFFSAMPYPAEGLYSLTHVRYTPHKSWRDDEVAKSAYDVAASLRPESRYRQMMLDAKRLMPCIADSEYCKSIYDVKTVLLKNERDDGRPILFHRQPAQSRVISVMGGKIDNIYDLFDLMAGAESIWAAAHTGYLIDAPGETPLDSPVELGA